MMSEEVIANFLRVPVHLEHFMRRGWRICTRGYASALLPRDLRSLALITTGTVSLYLIALPHPSMLYHLIRQQSTVKLYVIFNVLDVADRLLTSLGADVMRMRGLTTFSFVYISLHSSLLFVHLFTLIAAINAKGSNALLALLLSTQFVVLKGSVFKKFDMNGLMQLSGQDVVERFQLFIYLVCMAALLLPEDGGMLVSIMDSLKVTMAVVGSELFVDWVKHMFICKFNSLDGDVYRRFEPSAITFVPYPIVCVTWRVFLLIGFKAKLFMIGLLLVMQMVETVV